MTEIERRLLEALSALSGQVEALTTRLETMTNNYRVLSNRMEALEKQLNGIGKGEADLIESLQDFVRQQSVLQTSVEELRNELGKSPRR